jgi:hypothetical protein
VCTALLQFGATSFVIQRVTIAEIRMKFNAAPGRANKKIDSKTGRPCVAELD